MMYRKLCKDTTNERNNIGLTLIFRYFTKIACNLLLVYAVCGNKKRAIVDYHSFCRDDTTRTCDPLVPNQVYYQLYYVPNASVKASAKVV